ncbi:MAG TPA: hypothetical protein VIM62_02770 [Acidobacteriaceae bacterium]
MADTDPASGELAPVVTPQPRVSGVQFATAEYAHLPHTETCAACAQQLGESYYRAGEKKLCSGCAERVLEAFPRDTHARFTRAMLLGAGAALLGLAVYAGFTIVTHIFLGYLALGVGWLIGKAMMKGSGGVGGRRYQIAATVLTYAAISLAAVPILLAQILQNPKVQNAAATLVGVLLRYAPKLLWIGIASPFLRLQQPAQGLLGLFILFIGLRIAWRMTQARNVAIDGPYPVA